MKKPKKIYQKPLLISRKVELGVFGDYGGGDDDGPTPTIKIIPHPDLHMD